MYTERHSIKIQFDMQVSYFKTGVNIKGFICGIRTAVCRGVNT